MAVSKENIKKSLATLKKKNPKKLKRQRKKTKQAAPSVAQEKSSQPGPFDHIPITQESILESPLLINLKSLLNSAELIHEDMRTAIHKQDPSKNSKKMTLAFNNDVANPLGFFSEKLPILETYIVKSKHLIALMESQTISTTHLFDYCNQIYELEAQNYDLNVAANSNTEEGPVIRLFSSTIETCYQFLDTFLESSG